MKLAVATVFFLAFNQFCSAQANGTIKTVRSDPSTPPTAAPAAPTAASTVTILGANPHEETLIRSEIDAIQPAVLPLRVVFVPHWKYVDNTRIFQLHIPKGYTSSMFTHLPSRTTFIDAERYLGDEYLRHYFAHELGHLATSSAKEEDAEKAAHEFRKRLKDERKRGSH
jgi:hypothetical protein